jgi:P-type E1-E2 ATPase
VAALKKSLKPLATCKRDDKWQTMDATMLVPGDLVLLGAGAAVPADCIVNEGRIEVDQAALTGESLPVTMRKGDTPKMGSTSEADSCLQAGKAALLGAVGCWALLRRPRLRLQLRLSFAVLCRAVLCCAVLAVL